MSSCESDLSKIDQESARALVVLGCAVRLDTNGQLRPGELARRLEAAARVYAEGGGQATVVVATGGRRWGDAVEADVMARELVRAGVPERVVVRERCSLSTRDNARFTAATLARRGIDRATVVTSEWHLPRALTLFRRGVGCGRPGGRTEGMTGGRRTFGIRAACGRLRGWRGGAGSRRANAGDADGGCLHTRVPGLRDEPWRRTKASRADADALRRGFTESEK